MSGKVAVVTDSTAYLEPDVVKEFGIHIVPLTIQLEGKRFKDGLDIDTGELFRRLSSVAATLGP